MAGKDIAQGTSLKPEDKTRYLEIASGVYARVDGAYVIVGSSVVSSSSPMPITTNLTIDPVTGTLVTQEAIHYAIHVGKLYTLSYKSPNASLVADDGVLALVISTSFKQTYMIGSIASGGDAEMELYEGTNIDLDGTPLVPQNRNRNCAIASDMTVVLNPTINADGLVLLDKFIPGGTGGSTVGMMGSDFYEWSLQIGVNYMLRLTNRAGLAQPMSIALDWHEE